MDRPNSVAPLAWLRATPTGSNGMWRNQCCAECRLCVWLMLEDMPLLGYTFAVDLAESSAVISFRQREGVA